MQHFPGDLSGSTQSRTGAIRKSAVYFVSVLEFEESLSEEVRTPSSLSTEPPGVPLPVRREPESSSEEVKDEVVVLVEETSVSVGGG